MPKKLIVAIAIVILASALFWVHHYFGNPLYPKKMTYFIKSRGGGLDNDSYVILYSFRILEFGKIPYGYGNYNEDTGMARGFKTTKFKILDSETYREIIEILENIKSQGNTKPLDIAIFQMGGSTMRLSYKGNVYFSSSAEALGMFDEGNFFGVLEKKLGSIYGFPQNR